MCEIAIVDPSKYSTSEMKRQAMLLYERMKSSLGLMAVFDEGNRFTYDVYKAVEPDPDAVFAFIEDLPDDVKRFVIHGRLATHGEVNEQNAHPLEIECPKCDVDYVVHNGVVANHHWDKREHTSEGHKYTTGVDSEVIAHNYGKVPTEFDDSWEVHHSYQPGFILLNDESIYISAGQGYHLSDEAVMARTNRSFGPDATDDNYARVIMTPKEA